MTKESLSKAVHIVAALCLSVGLSGCLTARPTAPTDLGLLAGALTEPVEDLQGRADAGQARAQYAMAVLHTYGVRGALDDQDQAAGLRRRALAARGYTPITTYMAGLGGKPGRVVILNTPQYDLDAGQAWRVDQCAAALARGEESPAAIEACAGPEMFARLKAMWFEASAGH